MISTSALFWIVGIALTIGVALGTALGTYLWHLIPERSRDAKERCRVVYDGLLIKKLNEVIRGVEKGDSLYFDLDEFEEKIKSLSLKPTKDCLDKLNKDSKDYIDMHNIANSSVKGKLEKLLKNRYKNISSEEQGKVLSHLKGNGDVAKSLLKYFDALEIYLVKAKVRDEDISFDWFKNISGSYGSLDWKVKLNEILRDVGESLESIFQELNSQLNEEASIRFLKEKREFYLNETRKAKEKLESDAKKLKSKLGFVYGVGDEQMLQDLKEKIKMQEEGSLRGRI